MSPPAAASSNIDISEDPPHFDARHFIGLHKEFPAKNIADLHYQGARAALLEVIAVPDDIHHLPSDDLTIRDCLAMDLPSKSYIPVLSKPRTWYREDLPTTDVACLMSRPIPPKDFLSRLESEAGQAWFDGCKSILESKPFGHGLHNSANTLDFSPLIAQRLKHQTKHAEHCTRTKTTKLLPAAEETMRRQILRKFQELLKDSDQARTPSTAVERRARWNMGSMPAGAGNAANAAAVASAVASKAATQRTKLFKQAKVPHFLQVSMRATHIICPVLV
ncbi:hypothetical protein B0H14DRAFT_3685188 [Mycena olivaceomarginata]|nr:hypothetical protein B0H14DRAFT_3685188 [Mycena olivaceomarginata]